MAQASGIKDRYGLTLTTSSPKAAEHYIEGLDLLLEQNFGSEEKFRQATEADEGFALAHAGLALMQMFRAQPAEAKATIKTAVSLASGTTRRERQQVDAISLFVNGKGPQALAAGREHLAEFPRDILLLRVTNRLYMLGCSGAGVAYFPQELFAMLKGLETNYGDDWAFLGQSAFAHHETEQFDKAYELADRSLAIRPTNAHACHSVAHVFFEKGDASSGGDFLGNWLKGYDMRAPFHVHLSWHQALFELAQGRYDNALSLYETDIRPSVAEKSAASLADSASLLWRLRIYGGENPPIPVEEIRNQAAPAASSGGPAFRDAHAALAFAASGDEANLGGLVDRLKNLAREGNALADEITLPLVKGIGAFANEEYDEAVRLIEPVFPQLTRIGGSHAQREVFEDTLLEAYLRAEQYDKAEDFLYTRLKRRASVRDSYWLGRTQANTGRTEEANKTLKAASQGWQSADGSSPEIVGLNKLVESTQGS